MALVDRARERLSALETAGLLRHQVELDRVGPVVRLGDREVLSLASNDYLGLAAHPELAEAVAEGARRWGSGAGASRLVTGHLGVHRLAEDALARWLGLPASLLFASGHAANVGAVQALVGEGDLVLSDALNHASIIDGCRLSRARVLVFRHRDLEHAAQLLAAHRAEARDALIATDAVFSMDGDRADLPALRTLADRFDAALMVDEAHSVGVLGPDGRGLSAELHVQPDVLVGTLGKALGLAGAFAAAAPEVVSLLVNRARSYVFSTGMAPPIAAAVPTAVALARAGRALRQSLEARATQLRVGLRAANWPVAGDRGPIVPVVLGPSQAVLRVAASLERQDVLVRPIRPPTVPEGTARLRLTVSASHTAAQIDRALMAFAEAR